MPQLRLLSRAVVVVVFCALIGAGAHASANAAPDERRSLSVSPTSGPAGSSVTVVGTGWDPAYYSTGVQIGFYQNYGNGVLTSYADEMSVQPDAKGRFSFDTTIPTGLAAGDIITFSGLIGNGGGENANFTVTGSGPAGGSTTHGPDLAPTAITFDQATASPGSKIHFDSGIVNNGDQDSGVFNIKWFVDNREVGAYGSHDGVPAGRTVLNGNSQFDWTFDAAGSYTVEFRVDVDNHIAESNENNNSTSVQVMVAAAAARGGTSNPTFYCIRGPNGGCKDITDPKARTTGPTWNEYLDYLDQLGEPAGGIDHGVTCVEGAAASSTAEIIFGCLGLAVHEYPALGLVLNTVGCGIGAAAPEVGAAEAIKSCVGLSLQALHGVVQAIRLAAKADPQLADFLKTRMF